MADRLTLRQAESTIQQILADRLELHGFSKTALLKFSRAVSGVGLQRIMIPTRSDGFAISFSCNLSTKLDAIRSAFSKISVIPELQESLFCPIHFLTHNKDFCERSGETAVEIADASRGLAEAIEEQGLRYFRNCEDQEWVIAELKSQPGEGVFAIEPVSQVAMLSVFYLARGRTEETERAFDEEIASGRHEGPRRRPRIESVRRQLLGEWSGSHES